MRADRRRVLSLAPAAKGQEGRPVRLELRLAALDAGARPRAARSGRREFHISRECRSRYQFNHALFAITGNVVLADYTAVRIFAQKLNERRGPGTPQPPVRTGALNAMGLIDEILHYVVGLYAAQVRPSVLMELVADLEKTAGAVDVRRALAHFCRDFPPEAVYRGQLPVEEFLLGTTQGTANRETALEEMLLLWLANANPAFTPFRELFDDSGLAADAVYAQLPDTARSLFSRLPPFGPDNQNLVDMLRSPALAFPDSLAGQLQFIREKWGLLLGKFLERILTGTDLIREDEKKYLPGPGPATVFEAGLSAGAGPGAVEEGERFSPDRDWMPRLVLMAKTVYVWLDQLSRKYGRTIATLDAVPDEELDTLARWGFSGLWLIGVWERSPASRRIKQACGNPEAMASAYSLYRYEIAGDLGGEAALENLKSRAWARGIRLASDMVPNHMGIDSPWVAEHPEWFVGLDQSPFPAYRFTGEDLSSDPRVGIYLEDHYYDRSDAAVVFKWIDRRSGKERYIYHGNDGTRMPWNDTAQLNYLRPDVREAVLQTILDVSRKFPIIRFDAAMTLARKHYQRLWFPLPGSGGDIPSRAGQGLPQEHFNRMMPWEFWREVVDRMAGKNPDTLLLAEAFWLMESYFVRTLGMHRVYNSAFMNFLKMEENAKFRQSLKNALEFNPEILKRFVNFMNNPDEETALAQFGSGDKYFGACTLMATLPGLPMFGHGQVEGFSEKYGMEYRRAYLDERPDEELVRRHERQVFPLLRHRALFAGVDDFRLYDFFTSGGSVDENVIAFSNCLDDERCLVVVNNRYAATAGWIRVSAAFAAENPFGGSRSLRREDLVRGLGLRDEPGCFVAFRDRVSGLVYIRSCRDLCTSGMHLELGAYQAHVFLDFREMADDANGRLAALSGYLQGRGVASLDEAGREMALLPLHEALRELCLGGFAARLTAMLDGSLGGREENALWLELEEKSGRLVRQAADLSGVPMDGMAVAEAIVADLLERRALALSRPREPGSGPEESGSAATRLRWHFQEDPETGRQFVLWACLRRLVAAGEAGKVGDLPLWDAWRLDAAAAAILRQWGCQESGIGSELQLLRASCEIAANVALCAREITGAGGPFAAGAVCAPGQRPADDPKAVAEAVARLVGDLLEKSPVQASVQVNRSQGDLFVNKELFGRFCEQLTVMLLWELQLIARKTGREDRERTREAMELMCFLPALAGQVKYKLTAFREKLSLFAKG